MSKGDKKKKIIAGIVGSAALIGGATGGILYTSEMEIENEAIENEEEKGKGSKVLNGAISRPIEIKLDDDVQDLATILPDAQRNLGSIVINEGNDVVIEQIKSFLINKGIDTSQVKIMKIRLNNATIKPIINSVLYSGNPIVVYFTADNRETLTRWIRPSERNMGVIMTDDGATRPTAEQIKTKLAKLHVDTSQVEISNIGDTTATIKPIINSGTYRGNAITIFFTVDSRQDLATLLSNWQQRNLGTIITTSGFRPTAEQIKAELIKKDIDTSQVEISKIEDTTVTIKPIASSTKYKGNVITVFFRVANKSQNLTTLLPISQRNLGNVYIGQTATNDKQQAIRLAIADILHNKYNLDVINIAIEIDNNQNQAIISSLNKNVYIESVTLNYTLDMSFVTLDYLVPDLHTRQQKVAPYFYSHYQQIVDAKNDILNDNEFKKLPEVNNFINELNEKVKYKASNDAINAFNKLENNNENFKDFEDLKQQIDQHHRSFNGKINFDAFIKTITNYYHDYNKYNYYQQIDVNVKINELKIGICRFYNILAQVYGKDNVLKMLQRIELDQQFYEHSPYKFVRTSILGFL